MLADSIAALLAQAESHLGQGSSTPRLEAEVLLSHALSKPRSYLYAWPEHVLQAAVRDAFTAMLARRARGEPVAYLVGQREFWSLPLRVTPDTLIPRPETERLVELALPHIAAGDTVADLGTGSGAVALAIAWERRQTRVIATDNSAAALTVAQANARSLDLSHVEFRLGDWCGALGQDRCAVIVSNPPYLAVDDPHLRQGDLRFEPETALVAGPRGLDCLRSIMTQARHSLRPGGCLLLEHGLGQGETVLRLLERAGFIDCADYPDNAGVDRVSYGCWRG
ncbi:MAG: peptide chain release factor N(5)-glutamine methyltransferase [Gammaproteobacteria bacterium]|nr:peptide chain release factor N(5)-glutamine methyltransferase [Gammaproteobacteria bacterium]MCP5424214.1 peptide chain release factor N(5)-glutamine methyltransferase [Gammaproteobacteria bacterium]MCP5458909.1 peptide chain release factor N(5)-glutamine methyltransferase [Gammaproteobacteria bacterium]